MSDLWVEKVSRPINTLWHILNPKLPQSTLQKFASMAVDRRRNISLLLDISAVPLIIIAVQEKEKLSQIGQIIMRDMLNLLKLGLDWG